MAETIRVYFRDHQHQESYLSFATEAKAADCVRRVRDRLKKITVHDEVKGIEREDKKAIRRIKTAALSNAA